MAIATAQGRENAAGGFVAGAAYASLHTADPGATGASEVTGGTPAYARKAITWSAGTVDGVYTSGMVEFDVPPSTLTHVGLWTAVTGGTFLDKAAVSATFVSQGKYRIVATFTAS